MWQQFVRHFGRCVIFCGFTLSLAQTNPLSNPEPLAPDQISPPTNVTSWSDTNEYGWGGNYWANACEGDTSTETWASLFLQSANENNIRGYLDYQGTQMELLLTFEPGSSLATGTGTLLDENGMPSGTPAAVTLELKFPVVTFSSGNTVIDFGAQGYTYFTGQAEGCQSVIDTSYQPDLSSDDDYEPEEGEEDE